MNVYPDPAIGQDVLHLHLEVPASEFPLWTADGLLTIEANWKEALGGMKFVSKPALTEALSQCSMQGQFLAHVQEPTEQGYLSVTLQSVGPVHALESPSDAKGEPEGRC